MSPTSEDLQCKDNVHFPPQKNDGATKNEGYFRQGPKQDPTLSDGRRNGNTLNKVRNIRFSDIQKKTRSTEFPLDINKEYLKKN